MKPAPRIPESPYSRDHDSSIDPAGKRPLLRLHVAMVFALTLLLPSLLLAANEITRPILFVGDQDYPPIEFLENGVAKGLCVDIVNAMSRASGRKMTIKLLEWEKAQQMVRRSDADALGLLAITEERKSILDFTDVVMDLEYSLFTRSDQPQISTLSDLKGKSVGVIEGGFPMQFLKQTGMGIRLVIVADYDDGLRQLEQRTIQAFAGDKWVALFHMQQKGINDVRAISPPFATREAAFAVKRGNLPLLQEINRSLAQIKHQDVLKEILDRWSGKQIVIMTRERLTRSVAIASLAALLVLTLSLFFWVYTLKRQIAERKLAENSLKESESRFRNIFDNSPVAIGIGQLDGKLVEVNPAWLKLFGYEHNEVIGRTTTDLGLYANGNEREEIIKIIKEHGKVVNRSTQMRRKSGEVLDALYFAEIFTFNSKPYLQVMITDITERKRAEELLNKGKVEIFNLFNNSEVAMFRSRLDGAEIVNANEKFFAMVGRTREEVVGKPAMVHYADLAQRSELISRLRHDGRVVDADVRLLDKEGNVLDCLASMTLYAEEGVLDGSIIDVTEQKKVQNRS